MLALLCLHQRLQVKINLRGVVESGAMNIFDVSHMRTALFTVVVFVVSCRGKCYNVPTVDAIRVT